MFAPFCPVHGSRVLLFSENIRSVRNTDHGIDIYYRCNCGYLGIWHTGRS